MSVFFWLLALVMLCHIVLIVSLHVHRWGALNCFVLLGSITVVVVTTTVSCVFCHTKAKQ